MCRCPPANATHEQWTGRSSAVEADIEEINDMCQMPFVRSAEEKSQVLSGHAALQKRVVRRNAALIGAKQQLQRLEQAFQRRAEQLQTHRDILLELAQSDKSDWQAALHKVCSLAAATLGTARVSYWSLASDNSSIVCELLYHLEARRSDEQAKGLCLRAADYPHYFAALSSKRPLVASEALTHPATCALGERYLAPLGISSMMDAPVWFHGGVVGVLCHEQVGPARDWTPEEIDFASALSGMISLALEESKRTQSEHSLRESEEKFRALFEASSQGVILHDESRILEVNPASLKILGFESAAEMIGQHPAALSAPLQPGGETAESLVRRHIDHCLTQGSARFDWVVRNSRGTEVPIEVILTRIPWGGRQLIQAVFHSIAERKAAEAEMAKTLAREKELGQLRSKFISMVSHEFRTPLGIIQSSSEILDNYQDQLEAEERLEHLRSIQKNTQRMAGLMEEVLLLGKFDAGKMDFQPTPLELRAFITKLVEEVLSATNRRCPILVNFGAGAVWTRADEHLLRSVFTNLLTNATKYSNPGSPVWFDIQCAGSELRLTVRDQGIGIPQADQEWLFSAFHRGRNVGDRPGTGLGLVIVKRCVDLHGGRIEVTSNPGEGTSVTVILPHTPKDIL
jgi:PAS domain S-box-containing protein